MFPLSGEPAELRWFKFVEHGYNEECHTESVWRSDEMIQAEIKSYRTSGYCNFSDVTTSRFNKDIRPLLSNASYDSVCCTAVFSISNVTDSDFGVYRYGYEYTSNDASRKITLVREYSAPQHLAHTKCVLFVGGNFNWIRRAPLGQCMVYGTENITWYIAYDNKSEPAHNASSLSDMDTWQNLSVIEIKYQPYDGVTESFILFKITAPIETFSLGYALNSNGAIADAVTVNGFRSGLLS